MINPNSNVDYDIPQIISRDIAEHECFITFNSDEDCALFHEWLQSTGMKAFEKWRFKEIQARESE